MPTALNVLDQWLLGAVVSHMTHSSDNSHSRFHERLRNLIQLVVLVVASGIFFAAGLHSLLTASQTTLSCQIEPQSCQLTRSTVISRQQVDFTIAQLEGAYLDPTGSVMLRIRPEYKFSEGIYSASAPYGQDILQQAIANEINEFVQNPAADFRVRVSDQGFKLVVGLTLMVVVGIFPAFLLAARQTGRRRSVWLLPMLMISFSLFLTSALLVLAINHRIDLRCAAGQCVLSAWRLQAQGSIALSADELQATDIRQMMQTNDEGDTYVRHQVVLLTEQGEFSLLANAQAMPAIALADEVNQFISNPATSEISFRTDNWPLTIALAGVCCFMGGIVLLFAFRR